MSEPARLRLAGESEKAMPKRFNFTRQRLEAVTCPADKDRVYVFDRHTPSLAYCKTSAGGESFYLYKRIQGRPVRYRLADGGIPVDDARKLAMQRLVRIANGEDVQAARMVDRKQMTVGQLFTHWREVEGDKKRSIDQYQETFDRYAAPIATRRVSAVYQHDVAKLHADVGRENGQYVANRMLAVLSIIFRWSANHFDTKNPVKGIKRFPEYARERFLQPNELQQFYDGIESEPDPLWRDYWLMLLATGQRRCNVSSMAWEDVDLVNKVWRISAHSAKGKKALSIPLSDEAMTVLRSRWEQRGEDDYVFTSFGTSRHVVEPKAAWTRLLLRAGLENLRIHDIRRTVGSYMAMSGVSDRLIGGALGQTTAQATNVYARLRAEPIRAAMLTGMEALQTARKASEKEKQ